MAWAKYRRQTPIPSQIVGLLEFSFHWQSPGNRRLPISKAILGGTPIPDHHGVMGYGPVRYLTPAEVREVFKALDEFPIQSRARSFDAAKAEDAKVYVPNHEPEELIQYFIWLTSFYRTASENGEAVLLWID